MSLRLSCREWLRLMSGMEEQETPERPVVDLENLIKKKAWEMVDVDTGCCCRRRRCSRKNKAIVVDWNYIDREDRLVSMKIRPSDTEPPRNITLFETTFENHSGSPQHFAFKAERQTVSSFELSITKGFSVGGNFNLSFSVPDAGSDDTPKLSSSLGGHVTWSGQVGKKMTKSETLSWGVDSQVSLENGKGAVASLSVMEAAFVADLVIHSTLTATASSQLIPVDVISTKDDSLLEIIDLPCSDLCEDRFDLKPVDGRPDQLTFETHALCRGVYGVEQNVTVRPLSPTASNRSILHSANAV